MSDKYLSLMNTMTTWLIIAAVFSINLPIAFGSISLGLLLIVWLVSGDYQKKYRLISANPGALVALLLLALYAIGITYSTAPLNESAHYFLKYLKLLLIPIAVSTLFLDRYREYAINAFLISLIGFLLVSYLNWLGFFDFGLMHHGTYMAIGFYFMLSRAKRLTGPYRLTWLILAALTIFNILVIADVRTGVITMFALFALFCFEHWGKRTLFYSLGVILLAFMLIQTIPSFKTLNPRLTHLQEELSSYRANESARQTSAGQRLDMYRNTITLIAQHPIFGGGTGSLRGEYAELIKGTDVVVTRVTNPHNQYLATTQDLGVVGLIVLLMFWITHWRMSYQLINLEDSRSFRAVILATVIGCLLNSLLLDSGDGRMYCLLAGIFLSCYQSSLKRVKQYS